MDFTKEYLHNLREIIDQKRDAEALELMSRLHPEDIADLYDELDLDEAVYLYLLLDGEKAGLVLLELDEDERNKVLEQIPSETIAGKFVGNLETDDAAELIRELDEEQQDEILSQVTDIEQAGDIIDLLKYEDDTAGSIMGTEMIIVNENWSMPKCIDEMRMQAEDVDEIYYVYVIDDEERLKGVLPLKKLITSPSASKIKYVMKEEPISVKDNDPIEEVAEKIEKYDLVALPVVDSIGRLLGRITIDDVLDEIREQHERDY
ncbi:magnesium transporter, partial [Porphyromonas loveana]